MIKLAKELFVNPNKVVSCNMGDSFVILRMDGYKIYFNYRTGISNQGKLRGFNAIMSTLLGAKNRVLTIIESFESCEIGNEKYLFSGDNIK